LQEGLKTIQPATQSTSLSNFKLKFILRRENETSFHYFFLVNDQRDAQIPFYVFIFIFEIKKNT